MPAAAARPAAGWRVRRTSNRLPPVPFADLRSFLKALEAQKELKRITVEVDPELEITEIATRVVKKVPPYCLKRSKARRIPSRSIFLVAHAASPLRSASRPQELGAELAKLVQAVQPPSLGGLVEKPAACWPRVLSMRTTRKFRAASQEVVEEPNLEEWPILKCWPGDAGRFLTFPLVITEHPLTKGRNVGLYRMQVHSTKQRGAALADSKRRRLPLC